MQNVIEFRAFYSFCCFVHHKCPNTSFHCIQVSADLRHAEFSCQSQVNTTTLTLILELLEIVSISGFCLVFAFDFGMTSIGEFTGTHSSLVSGCGLNTRQLAASYHKISIITKHSSHKSFTLDLAKYPC